MRKGIFLLFVINCFTVAARAQEGIHFQRSAWADILQQAAQENKLVFIDAYTTWCGPCKQMSKEVFTQNEVAKFYNQKFVNYKIDMEKGEGPTLAKRYKVAQYPTLLFVDAAGNLVHRAAGYHDKAQLIELGNAALSPEEQLATQEQRFKNGDRDPDFLKSYAALRASSYDGSHIHVAEAYLKTQDNWDTEENRSFVFQYLGDIDSKMFDHFVKNRNDYVLQFGEAAVESKANTLVSDYIAENSTDEELIELKDTKRLYKKAYPDKAKELYSAYKMTYYRSQGDRLGYAKSAIKHYKKYPSDDPEELNEVAWTINSVVTKKKYLKRALKLAKKSVAIEPAFYNHDTMAALLYKLGKNEAAIEVATKAIDLAKQEGFSPEGYAETTKLIQTIRQTN
jgi:thioredoxin-related protein